MPKINILFLHGTSRMSGAENSLLVLARHLDARQFCPFFALPPTGLFVDSLKQNNIVCLAADYPQIRRLRGVKAALRVLQTYIKEYNISILHANCIRTNLYASLLAREAHIPVVWHQRNLLTSEFVDLDRCFSFLADRIICNSYAIAKRFLHFGKLPKKVRVVYSGVDTGQFSPKIDGSGLRKEFGIGQEEIVVGITSRFNLIKGHELFFQAAQRVIRMAAVKEKIRFLVVGGAVFDEDRKREELLRRLVKDLGIQDSVIFTGFRIDMPQVYAAMNILVLASKSEACGRVVFEAMASGRPVIGTDSGGTSEVVKDNVTGYIVGIQDAGDMAEKITRLVCDGLALRRMGESSRQRIEEFFSADKTAQEIGNIYMELMKG